ncbi:hypothetical protein CVT25_005338 [Psilocybe cyanescens]|uniref:F-box domain-containing protein n=1 Tax=Psilocybe cyanescens TaxID=93625 RepID=A0A409WWW5_PSICY|nr:hypothetical protein CVT25_005338 [Psilocybe cyanescens]
MTEDILWIIFMMNAVSYESLEADHDEEHDSDYLPLDTTRITSQVCREWRQILLETSSIWGRLMDWRSLNQETDHWRNEVLRRSGKSLIWIEGYADDHDNPKDCTLLFFHRLVFDHWERIERLSCFPTQYKLIEGLQTAIQRPAPNLEVFTLPDSPGDYHEFRGSMFAGDSPRLKIFRAIGSRCNLDAAWMTNIRELSLGRLFNNKTVSHVLAHLPRLESLELDRHTIVDGYRPPHIYLPSLRTLKLWECISYLPYIDPAPGCALFLWNESRSDILAFHDRRIAQMLHSFLFFHPAKRIHLECRPSAFILSERQLPHPVHNTPGYSMFDINLVLDPESSNDVLESLLSTLASPLFSSATDLTLMCCVLNASVFGAFKRFMTFFPALKNLWIHEQDLLMLFQDGMTDRNPLIFPNLCTLVVLGLSPLDKNKSSTNLIRRFLSLRQVLGAPIMSVDLTRCSIRETSRNLDFLGEYAGMKVMWKRCNKILVYECGNGPLEDLRFC